MAKEGKLAVRSLGGAPGLHDAGFRIHFNEVEFLSAVLFASKIPIVKGLMAGRLIGGKNQKVCPVRIVHTNEALGPLKQRALISCEILDAEWQQQQVFCY